MNYIYLKGIIKNITYSHTISGIDYNKADLIVKRPDGREDILIIKFKQFSLNCKEDSEIELVGNIRSFSQQLNGKNKVEIYVFSYFDVIESAPENTYNDAKISGKLCKKDILRTTSTGKHYIHFILANNLIIEDRQKLHSYIPCVAWGKLAKEIASNYNVNDNVLLNGQLHSREYKKTIDANNVELRVAHEFAVLSIDKDDHNEI